MFGHPPTQNIRHPPPPMGDKTFCVWVLMALWPVSALLNGCCVMAGYLGWQVSLLSVRGGRRTPKHPRGPREKDGM